VSVFIGVAAAVVELAPPTVSFAQDASIVVAQNNRPNFFQRLFGNPRRSPRTFAPRRLFPGFERDRAAPAPQRERRQRAPSQPTPHEVAAVEKAEDAKRAMVVGDFMAGSLAKGLAEAYRENPNVVVINASNGSSGLVRDDFYDWPVRIPELVESQKPDAILVMIGANDRQAIGSESPGTDAWRAAYVARIVAFADALKATGKPVLWGGLVPVSSSTMSRDYSSFNGIMREQLEAKGIKFIDLWNGFADDEGKYVAVGPDVRGQSVQLRGSDGLNFTRAGQRKLGYFFEQDLNDVFGGNALQVAATPSGAAVAPGVGGPQIGPMVSLDALSLAGGDALSSGPEEEKRGNVAASISARLTNQDAEAPPAGRVDSYLWPPTPAPASTPAAAASAGESDATPEAATAEQ